MGEAVGSLRDFDFGTTRFGSRRLRDRRTRGGTRTAFFCADLDLTREPREEHAAYIANWLDVLTADYRAIVTAASPAQRVADFINGLQPAASARYLPTVASGRCIRPIDIL